ncbi:MAG: hypothetical protein ACFCD0_12460 [Gemmataceae bacterium]
MNYNVEQLLTDIQATGTEVETQKNVIHFRHDNIPLTCIYDEGHDRMRFLCAIIKEENLDDRELHTLLSANFHTALDARYAISEGVVYSAFLHPLSSLTTEMTQSAIRQVATLRRTFGTQYSSGELYFPG